MYPILVTCPRELPAICAREITELGLPVVAEMPAGVETRGTLEDCLRLNLWLRTAHRVLLRLGSFTATTSDAMYEAVTSVEWEDWIPANGFVSVISSVDTKCIDNVMYANMRCKDAVVDRIRSKKGIRPDSGPGNTGSVVFLYWHDETLMVYVDTSGAPLSDRGYRVHPAKAPMRETLAAAVIMSTRWSPDYPFINPMCGSGTLGIEAALIGHRIAPGSMRTNFGFHHLLPFKPRMWHDLRDAALAQADLSRKLEIHCSDIDQRVIRQARDNAKRAGVSASFRVADIVDVRPPNAPLPSDHESGTPIVIVNPEFGIRLGDENKLRDVYRMIGDVFKQQFQGYTGYVFTGNFRLAKEVGLRSSRRMTFWSADLECRLLEFELYSGTKKQYARLDGEQEG